MWKPKKYKGDAMGGGYKPSHPWYYMCGGKLLHPDEITVDLSDPFGSLKFWKEQEMSKVTNEKLAAKWESLEKELAEDIARYEELCEMEESGDPEPWEEKDDQEARDLSHAVSLGLKHNHIHSCKSRMEALRQLTGGVVQSTMF